MGSDGLNDAADDVFGPRVARLRSSMWRYAKLPYLVPAIVLVVASFLLSMAALLPLVVAPRAARLPLGPYAVLVAEGSGSYFASDRGQVISSDQLSSSLTIRGDLGAGSDDVAVWDTFVSVLDLQPTDEAPYRVVSELRERVALDRTTARPVGCCGADPAHEGLTYRFPFDTQPEDYSLWDPRLKAALPATFARMEHVGSLPVYVFVCGAEPTAIATHTVPGRLLGSSAPAVDVSLIYAAEREVWVEPRSGRIVNSIDDIRQTLEHEGGEPVPYATMQLEWTEETVGEQTSLAAREAARLHGVSSTLPLTALFTGAMLFALGIILTILVGSAPRDR